MKEQRVGIGEVVVADGDTVLVAYGVGSCVALILHDPVARVGGLAHILVPESTVMSTKCPGGAIRELLRLLVGRKAAKGRLVAKIVGGAAMFDGFHTTAIGRRNVERTKDLLRIEGIPLVGEDVLGAWGRSVFFHVDTGEVVVRSYRFGERSL